MTVKNAVTPQIPFASPSRGRHSGRPRHVALRAHLPLLTLLAVLVALHRWWGAELALFALLLVLPGVLLLRALRVPGTAVAAFPVYVPAASLAVLTVSSLAVDAVGPLIGVRQPLRTVPLLIGVEVSCALLLAVSHRAPETTAIPWRALDRSVWQWWPLLVPLLAGAGALRLNDGHGPAVAVLATAACLVTLLWGLVRAPRLSTASLTIILCAVSLAVMWAFSLRGDIVYGFDISTEYHSLHQTVLGGVWHFAHPGDAYGALPAVTLLPAELHSLSGISDLMVLKLLYPAITAMFPVAIFSLGLRIITRRWAFMAAAFIVVQSTFAQELPALARQEIAMIFFIAMLCAVIDTGVSRPARWTLGAVFGVGMALSHYSTTYFAIGMLALFLVLQWVVSWFRDVPRVAGSFMVALVAATAGAAIWYGPVTHSASNVSQFVGLMTSHGLDLLPNRASGANLISSYLNGNTQTPMSASEYQRLVAQEYAAQKKFVIPLPDSGAAKYALRSSTAPEPPVRLAPVHSLLGLGELLAEQLAELLGAIGAIVLALRRQTATIARQLALLGAGTLLALVVIRFSGTVASEYNQQRAFVQAFAVLAIAMAWTLQGLTARLRRWRSSVTAVAAVALAVLFAEMSGLAGAALGGGTATNLTSSGEDYERYGTTVPEIASAQWLGEWVRPRQLVYADRYGELRLNAETTINSGLLNDITPQTLDQNAWVYATRTNLGDGRARQLFGTKTVSYAFPLGFVDANFNLVYANGFSEVFRG
jgi:uncharacterized membrane protein